MIQWPNIGLYGELIKCVDDIIAALNTNFFLLDILVQANFNGFVENEAALPEDAAEGDTYINEETGEINSLRNGEWVIISAQTGWRAWLRDTNELWYYDGTEWLLFSQEFISSIGSSTDDALVRWDGTTGKFIQNSIVTLTDAGIMAGLVELNVETINSDEIFTDEIESNRSATDLLETALLDAEYQAVTVPTGSITLATPTKLVVKLQSAIDEINSITPPTIGSLNRFHVLVNERASDEILLNNSSGNIRTGTGEDLPMLPGSSVWIMYDKVLNLWRVVGGSGSGSGGGTVPTVYEVLASGSATFTLPIDPVLEDNIQVYDGGVRQSPSHFTLAGLNITLDYIPVTGNEMLFVIGEVNTINVPANNSVSTIKIQDNSITNPKMANNSISTNNIIADAVTNAKLADDAVTALKIETSLRKTLIPALSTAVALPTVDNTAAQFAHGLGVIPSRYTVHLVCNTAQHGYAVGDVVDVTSNCDGDGGRAYSTYANSTTVNIMASYWSAGLYIKNRLGGGGVNITAASWRLVFRAWA